jgi:hypothetical protein
MLNNPDIQLNATINRWIASILLFDFNLVHIPGITHGSDSLSSQPAQPDDLPEKEDDYKDWIDWAYGFMHIINPTTVNQGSHLVLSLFTLTNTDTPADMFSQLLTTNFVHCICATLTDIINTTLDFTLLIEVNPNKVYIPQNNEQDNAYLKLNLVVALLCNIQQSADMTNREFKGFIRYTQDFFLKGNVLWCKNFHGFHKVVILPSCCLWLLHRHTIMLATTGLILCAATWLSNSGGLTFNRMSNGL